MLERMLLVGARLRMVITVLIVALFAYELVFVTPDQTAFATFAITLPNSPPTLVSDCALDRGDGYEVVDDLVAIEKRQVNASLCFKPFDDGSISYAAAPGKPGFYITGQLFSSEVESYQKSQAIHFRAHPPQRFAEAIETLARDRIREQRNANVKLAGGALAILWIVTLAFGWVLRGFTAPLTERSSA